MITSNVKKIMEKQRITIRIMVQDTGLADNTILRARCEKISMCRLYTLEAIAEYLDCQVKDLFVEK